MRKYVVRRRSDFYSIRFLMLSGVIIGVVSAICLAITFHYIDRGLSNVPLGTSVLILAYSLGPFALWFLLIFGANAVQTTRIRSVFHSALWGATVGVSCAAIAPLTDPTYVTFADVLILLATGSAVPSVLATLGWTWGRVWARAVHSQRVFVQNGSMCPTCTYSLIGNTSMICPECGVPYSFEELDTTKEVFESLHRSEGQCDP